MESLKNQIAVVTGASSGIGKAIALSLAAQGAGLYLAARRKEQLGKEGQAYKAELLLQPEDIAEMVTHSLRLPRTAEVTDISIRPMQKSY